MPLNYPPSSRDYEAFGLAIVFFIALVVLLAFILATI